MKLAIENVEKKFDEFIAVDNLSVEMDNGVYGLLGVKLIFKVLLAISDITVDSFCMTSKLALSTALEKPNKQDITKTKNIFLCIFFIFTKLL